MNLKQFNIIKFNPTSCSIDSKDSSVIFCPKASAQYTVDLANCKTKPCYAVGSDIIHIARDPQTSFKMYCDGGVFSTQTPFPGETQDTYMCRPHGSHVLKSMAVTMSEDQPYTSVNLGTNGMTTMAGKKATLRTLEDSFTQCSNYFDAKKDVKCGGNVQICSNENLSGFCMALYPQNGGVTNNTCKAYDEHDCYTKLVHRELHYFMCQGCL